MDSLAFEAAGIELVIDLRIGHIESLTVNAGDRTLNPLHRAPWVDEPDDTMPPGTTPGTRGLSGDFLCAPFSSSDVEPGPLHGWSANSRWRVVESSAISGGWRARLQLERQIMGATVEKILTLRDGHPFLYQEHAFIGGSGELPAAHHPMTAMRAGGQIAFSPKRIAFTPKTSLEPDASRGRYVLAYPAKSTDLANFPKADGGSYDLTTYPAEGRHEDFAILVEADHGGLGWTAVARHAERDLVLVLKNPAELPVTMLWLSNGGRDYAPWNSRHKGVLGIEDGRTAVGHAESLRDNDLSRLGVPTSFTLQPQGRVSFRHIIGALGLASGQERPASIEAAPGRLTATFADGHSISASFDESFLAGG